MKCLTDAKVQSLAECESGQLVRSIDRCELGVSPEMDSLIRERAGVHRETLIKLVKR